MTSFLLGALILAPLIAAVVLAPGAVLISIVVVLIAAICYLLGEYIKIWWD